jgi:DNA-binding NarL/FixJ family response regulator
VPVSGPRVMIAEDSVLLREGLTRILTSADQEVVGAYDNADELLVRLRTQPCDVVIMDIRLPPTHTDEGMRAALQIRRSRPDVAVLVLSQYVELGLALQLLSESGEGVGYLLKDRISDVATFVESVRRVAAGGSTIDPSIVTALLQRRRTDDPLRRLTAREAEALELMASGTSNQGIADQMVITLRAAEKYVSSVFDKLGIPSGRQESRRVLAVLLYLRS